MTSTENNFLPDLSKINSDDAKKAKLFYINYPNNPTGAVATDSFYDELIEFAIKKYNSQSHTTSLVKPNHIFDFDYISDIRSVHMTS